MDFVFQKVCPKWIRVNNFKKTDTREDIINHLKQFQFLNQGLGPVVPQVMAEHFRSLGVTEGYIEAKHLPLYKGLK